MKTQLFPLVLPFISDPKANKQANNENFKLVFAMISAGLLNFDWRQRHFLKPQSVSRKTTNKPRIGMKAMIIKSKFIILCFIRDYDNQAQ